MEQTEALGLLCPHCRVDLVMSERQGVEIDYCPKCRGSGWIVASSTRSSSGPSGIAFRQRSSFLGPNSSVLDKPESIVVRRRDCIVFS